MYVPGDREKLFFLRPLHETFKQVGNRCYMPGTHCTPNILVRSCSLWERILFRSLSKQHLCLVCHWWDTPLVMKGDVIGIWIEFFLHIPGEGADKWIYTTKLHNCMFFGIRYFTHVLNWRKNARLSNVLWIVFIWEKKCVWFYSYKIYNLLVTRLWLVFSH